MSSRLGREGGQHEVDVEERSSEMELSAHGYYVLPVDWPHMWHPGHTVVITTSDRCRYKGDVVSVSRDTKKVLIKMT